MSLMLKTIPFLAALAMCGCAASSYCEGEHDYQQAPSVPSLKGVEGLQLPDSAAALRIPAPPPNAVAYGETYKDEDGDDAVRCLDKPPEMPPTVEAKVEPTAQPKVAPPAEPKAAPTADPKAEPIPEPKAEPKADEKAPE